MQLQKALANLAKCYVAPNLIYKDKLKDELTFLISISVIDYALKRGVVTLDQVEKTIKGEESDIIYPQ